MLSIYRAVIGPRAARDGWREQPWRNFLKLVASEPKLFLLRRPWPCMIGRYVGISDQVFAEKLTNSLDRRTCYMASLGLYAPDTDQPSSTSNETILSASEDDLPLFVASGYHHQHREVLAFHPQYHRQRARIAREDLADCGGLGCFPSSRRTPFRPHRAWL